MEDKTFRRLLKEADKYIARRMGRYGLNEMYEHEKDMYRENMRDAKKAEADREKIKNKIDIWEELANR